MLLCVCDQRQNGVETLEVAFSEFETLFLRARGAGSQAGLGPWLADHRGPFSHLRLQIPQPTPQRQRNVYRQAPGPFFLSWSVDQRGRGHGALPPCWGRVAWPPFWGPPIHSSFCSWAGLRTVVSAAPLPGPWQAEGHGGQRARHPPSCRLPRHWAPSRRAGQRLRAQSLVNSPGARFAVNSGGLELLFRACAAWGGESAVRPWLWAPTFHPHSRCSPNPRPCSGGRT